MTGHWRYFHAAKCLIPAYALFLAVGHYDNTAYGAVERCVIESLCHKLRCGLDVPHVETYAAGWRPFKARLELIQESILLCSVVAACAECTAWLTARLPWSACQVLVSLNILRYAVKRFFVYLAYACRNRTPRNIRPSNLPRTDALTNERTNYSTKIPTERQTDLPALPTDQPGVRELGENSAIPGKSDRGHTGTLLLKDADTHTHTRGHRQ